MKKTLAFTLMVCLAIAATSQGQYCATIDFEDIATGTSVMGLDAVSPLLIISGTDLEVVEEGRPSGLLAYNANVDDIANSVANWLPGDNAKSFGNSSDNRVAGTEDITFTFNPDIVVKSFSIDMFDYGDWFPVNTAPAMTHTSTLTGNENAGGTTQDVLTFTSTGGSPTGRTSPTYGSLATAGDAWQTTGAPGRYTFSVSGDDLSSAELVFAGGQSMDPGVSFDNIEICYCIWLDETAWADGDLYNTDGKGNWATYTEYAVGTVDLLAGQDMVAGTVGFSPVDGDEVTITITLNDDWRFADVEENVKIQDYGVAPTGNPKPGQFAWKGDATGSPFEITVPANTYYGVHVNVERLDCGEE